MAVLAGLVPALLVAPALREGLAFLSEDLAAIHLPLRTMLLRALEAGNIPGWNPFVAGGMPFAADPHVAAWYPLNRLLALVVHDPARHLTWSSALHLAIAGWGAYAYLRQVARPVGALAGALFWALNGFTIAHAVHPGLLACIAWAGWLAFFLQRSRDRAVWLFAAVPVGALVLVAGNPHGAVLVAILAVVQSIGLTLSLARDDLRRGVRWVAAAVGAGLLSAGVAAIQVLPGLEMAAESFRMLPGTMSEQVVSWRYVLRLVAPLEAGFGASYVGPSNHIETCFFVGLVALGTVAMTWRELRPGQRWPVVLVGGIGLWLTLGVAGATAILPAGFRAHERYFIVFAAAFAVALARAVDVLGGWAGDASAVGGAKAVGDADLAGDAAVVGDAVGEGGPSGATAGAGRVPVDAAVVAALVGIAWLAGGTTRELWLGGCGLAAVAGLREAARRGGSPRWAAAAGVTVFVVAELCAFGTRLVHPSPIAGPLETVQALASSLRPDDRFVVVGPASEPWLNMGAQVELTGVRGYHPLIPARTFRGLAAVHPGATEAPHLLPWPEDAFDLTELWGVSAIVRMTPDGGDVSRSPTPPAPASFAYACDRAASVFDAESRLRAADASALRHRPIVEGAAPCGAADAPALALAWRRCGDDCFEARLPADATAGLLVVPLVAYPGWEALVDGEPARIYPANVIHTAIGVAGGSVARFEFRPQALEVGRRLSAAAPAIWLLAVVVTMLVRRRDTAGVTRRALTPR